MVDGELGNKGSTNRTLVSQSLYSLPICLHNTCCQAHQVTGQKDARGDICAASHPRLLVGVYDGAGGKVKVLPVTQPT